MIEVLNDNLSSSVLDIDVEMNICSPKNIVRKDGKEERSLRQSQRLSRGFNSG
jgi:hypothetical protein